MPPAPFPWVMLTPATAALLPVGAPRVMTLGCVAGTRPLLTPSFLELLDCPEALSLISAPDKSESLALCVDLLSPSSRFLGAAFRVGL